MNDAAHIEDPMIGCYRDSPPESALWLTKLSLRVSDRKMGIRPISTFSRMQCHSDAVDECRPDKNSTSERIHQL
jgi:hypothetical protein